jgi:hypothetical protein
MYQHKKNKKYNKDEVKKSLKYLFVIFFIINEVIPSFLFLFFKTIKKKAIVRTYLTLRTILKKVRVNLFQADTPM